MTFDKFVEPDFGGEPHCDNGEGEPTIGPDGGVIH